MTYDQWKTRSPDDGHYDEAMDEDWGDEGMSLQPRGGLKFDWNHWSLVYQRRLRKLKKLICAQGYEIRSDESGMPLELINLNTKSAPSGGSKRGP